MTKLGVFNDYKVVENTVEIFIYHKDKLLIALMDLDDLVRVAALQVSFHARWSDSAQTYYVVSHKKVEGIRYSINLHRFIMNLGDNWRDVVADHINHNGLDNRKVNLRVVPKSVNHINIRGIRTDNMKGYRGVSYHRREKNYTANIYGTVDGRRTCLVLGRFLDPNKAEIVAVKAREYIIDKATKGESVILTESFKQELRNYAKTILNG